jgi:uncharacterized protein YjbJ (UPF0337 family)
MELKRFQVQCGNDAAAQTLIRRTIQKTEQSRRTMDKDRIKGSLDQAKGKIKEGVGKATGDSKLETEGQADQFTGKVQNTIGGLKDKIRENTE